MGRLTGRCRNETPSSSKEQQPSICKDVIHAALSEREKTDAMRHIRRRTVLATATCYGGT